MCAFVSIYVCGVCGLCVCNIVSGVCVFVCIMYECVVFVCVYVCTCVCVWCV